MLPPRGIKYYPNLPDHPALPILRCKRSVIAHLSSIYRTACQWILERIMPADKDIIYIAATHVQNTLEKMGKNLGPSHAHELTAAYMGFNSKKALIDSGEYDLSDPELVLNLNPDLLKLDEKVRKMRPDLLQKFTIPGLGRLIKTGLTPPCECCGYRLGAVVPITGSRDGSVDGWVCMHCVDQDVHETYGACRYCDDGVVHRYESLNRAGECSEHAGESHMDPEEEAGWNDQFEYWQNHQ